jgi:hypothetical protein
MAKATTIKDALKKLEETRGVNAAELDKVLSAAVVGCRYRCCWHALTHAA